MNTTTTDKTDEMVEPHLQPYEVVCFNALKHGILSRYTVLSHENHADYESLLNSLMDEHLPAGATEQHLIGELASVSVEVDFEGLVLFSCKKSTGEVVDQRVQTQMTSCNFD